MSQVVSFKKSLAEAVFGLGRTAHTNVISHVVLIAMFAVSLGFPLMHGYDNFGLGLDILPSILLGMVIGIVCQLVFVPILALADFCESRSLA